MCLEWRDSSNDNSVTLIVLHFNNSFYFHSREKILLIKKFNWIAIIFSNFSEISLLKELKHPNVIHLQNVFWNRTTISLQFEYIPMDLKTYMIRLPGNFVFPRAVIQSYLYQITNAISYCHQRRIFHRNLCPQNILITRKGVIKVLTEFWTDF